MSQPSKAPCGINEIDKIGYTHKERMDPKILAKIRTCPATSCIGSSFFNRPQCRALMDCGRCPVGLSSTNRNEKKFNQYDRDNSEE